MPRSKSKVKASTLVKRLQERFPNFLLGLTVVVLAVLLGSIFLQNKGGAGKTLPQKLAEIFNFQKKDSSDTDSSKTYTVKSGDTLWSVAEEAYGSGYNAYDVAQANNIVDPNILNEGTVLKLPALEPKNPTRGEIASGAYTTAVEQAVTTDSPKTYVVKAGDTLWSIALKQYGNPYRWTVLWEKNPSVVNPDVIYAGNTLKLL